MPLSPSSSSGTLAFKHVAGPASALANVVEGIADWDIPDAGMARALAIKVLPSTTPYVIVQYRTSLGSSRTFGCAEYRHRHYRHVATKTQSGIVTVRPNGPLGAIIVRLRPEAAVRILGEGMQDFADAKISLGDVFSEGDVCLLEEMVSEAPGSPERYAHVLKFLLANANRREPDLIVCRAAALLRRSPALRVRLLSEKLDISERHLSRRFQTMFGTSPKQFARFARIEKALRARSVGSTWADIAYACGFADQAHMIKDFNAIAGAPPEHVLRLPSVEQHGESRTLQCEPVSHSFFVC